MKKTLKLMIVAKSIDGGTGTFVESLLKLPYSPKVLVLEKPFFRKLITSQAKYFYFFSKQKPNISKYHPSLSGVTSFTKEMFWLKENIKTFKPDLLLGVGAHANVLIMINKILFSQNIPAILTTHIELKATFSEKATPFLRFVLQKVVGILYKRAEMVVCVSTGVAQSLKKDFRLKKTPKVIHNGINTPKKIKLTPLKTKAPVFITITRLVNQKDNQTLIKAFRLVLDKLPEARLLILGDGPQKPKLLKLTKKLSLDRQVEFIGWVKNTSPYLRKANIFVLSSKREGFPYSLLEAMSQKKAVISTKAPHGPAEILDNGKYGLLVPLGKASFLANAMLKLAVRKKLYEKYAQRALKKSQDFSEDKMLAKYQKLITRLSQA